MGIFVGIDMLVRTMCRIAIYETGIPQIRYRLDQVLGSGILYRVVAVSDFDMGWFGDSGTLWVLHCSLVCMKKKEVSGFQEASK